MCVESHLRADPTIVICGVCCHRTRFYESIRRICDDRCFCSVQCSMAAETCIELLKRNDERCHLKSLNLKCATCNPELEFDDSIEGSKFKRKKKSFNFEIETNQYAFRLDGDLFNEMTATASDQVSEREQCVATMNGRHDNENVILSK